MFIKQIVSSHRFDFDAVMECEHCGHRQGITTGYDDANYHNNVIPKMTCASCLKNRAGEIPAEPSEVGCGPLMKAVVLAPEESDDRDARIAALEAECERLREKAKYEAEARQSETNRAGETASALAAAKQEIGLLKHGAESLCERAERAEDQLKERTEACEKWKREEWLRQQEIKKHEATIRVCVKTIGEHESALAAAREENERLRTGLSECEAGLVEDLRQIRADRFEAPNTKGEVVLADKCNERLNGRLGAVRGFLRGKEMTLRSRADDSGRVERVRECLRGWLSGSFADYDIDNMLRAVLAAADGR